MKARRHVGSPGISWGEDPLVPDGRALMVSAFERLKKILASDRLAILPVLDLHPGCRVRRVASAGLLWEDPLHVLLANHLEKVCGVRYVIHIQNRLGVPR